MKTTFAGSFAVNALVAEKHSLKYAQQVRDTALSADINRRLKDELPKDVFLTFDRVWERRPHEDYSFGWRNKITIKKGDTVLGNLYQQEELKKGFIKKNVVQKEETLPEFIHRAINWAKDLIDVSRPV